MSVDYRERRICGISAGPLFALAAVLSVTSPARAQAPNPVSLAQVVDANHVPSPQMVAAAARAINGLSPSIPTQSITVGGLNGTTGQFTFELPGVYPANFPEGKKCQTEWPLRSPPGCVPPRYVATFNSFNVKYVFGISNRPADLSISITLPNASGQMVSQPVPIDSTGRSASVSFHPYSFQVQVVSFTGTFQSGWRTVAVSITPYLNPQLGAFVVKHLLLAVVYEPPGSTSSSSFDLSNTHGTTWSFDFSGGYGIVDTVDTGALLSTISTVASGGSGALQVLGTVGWAAAGSIAPYVAAFGAAASVLNTLQGSQATTTTTVHTQGQSQSSGWSITVEKEYGTGGVHKYPGHGDRFVFLDDVLFVYAVAQNRVQLAPVAFTQDRSMTVDDLQAQAPDLAQKYGPLDLVLNPQAASAAQYPAVRPGLQGAWLIAFPPAPRVSYFMTPVCETSCPTEGCNTVKLTDTQYTSTGTSQTTTQTISIVDTPSLMDSMLGQKTPDQYYTATYTTNTQNWQQSAKATSVKLGCPELPTAHYVDLYIDNAFGTFFSILGPQVPPENATTGTVHDEHGQPAGGRQVILRLGGKNYAVFSDRQGNFAIPLAHPTGKGTVVIGKASYPVDFSRGPIRNMSLPTVGSPGVQPTVSSPGSSGAPQGAAKLQYSGSCCTIASVDPKNSIVTARQVTGGQTLQFAAPRSLLPNLKVGLRVWVDYGTQIVSVENAPNCCKLVAPPPAQSGPTAPRRAPGTRN